MEKKRFMQDLEEISIENKDEKLLALARKGNFSKAIEEISNRNEAKEIIWKILNDKPFGKEILKELDPHYGTKGLKSVLEQTGRIIGEDDFNQGAHALRIMSNYVGHIDVHRVSKQLKNISNEMNDLTLLEDVFKKYKNLEGKELIFYSLNNLKNDLLEKPFLEIIDGWKSDYVHSVIRELQTKRGLSPTLYAIKQTAKKIQKKEAMEDIALLSESFDYKDRYEKIKGLANIIMFKGNKDNFEKILKAGKNSSKKSIQELGQLASWVENEEIYNELMDFASEKDISFEIDRLEKIAYWNNEKIFEDSFNVLKNYYGKPESKRIMKKIAAINNFSQNDFISKYTSKMAIDYSNNSKRDKYLAEIQRYAVKGEENYVKDKLIEYNKPFRKENLENKLKKFVGNLK
ncbi:MAG TPA: hypothetical protein VJ895_02325 [Candidatus Nanoarchaeia archaeon]|nr:hypothetical protein [Candidatus Nanoarchaeia archaeon]